jgi:hypothetical protein
MRMELQSPREQAALMANQADAEMWRWFCQMHEENRIRWCLAHGLWYVSVDHRHLATEPDFDTAIRAARQRAIEGVNKTLRARKKKPLPSEVLVTVGVGRIKER